MKKRSVVSLTVAAVVLASLAAFAQDASSPAAVYERIGQRLKELNQKASRTQSVDAKMQIIGEMEAMFHQFRKDHPGSSEALDAVFQLGALKHSAAVITQEPNLYGEAVKYLAEFVVAGTGPRDKVAFAHYYMAESYKGMGLFDDAQKEYQTVVDQFGGVNPRLTQFAQMNLQDLQLERRLAIGSDPIPFTVKSTSGETLSPDKYKGKVLLLDFWATWCGPCKAEMPNVKKVYSKYSGKGFEIVGVSLDRSREAFDNYVAQNNIPWPQYFDGKYWNNDIAMQYGVRSIPATYLIDKKGKIRYKSLRGRQLEDAVERLLAEKL